MFSLELMFCDSKIILNHVELMFCASKHRTHRSLCHGLHWHKLLCPWHKLLRSTEHQFYTIHKLLTKSEAYAMGCTLQTHLSAYARWHQPLT
jgi:hypothetical protein